MKRDSQTATDELVNIVPVDLRLIGNKKSAYIREIRGRMCMWPADFADSRR
jgi:hypothetical protein